MPLAFLIGLALWFVYVAQKLLYEKSSFLLSWPSLIFCYLSLICEYFVPLKGDILEDPACEPKKDMYMLTVDPEDAPSVPE